MEKFIINEVLIESISKKCESTVARLGINVKFSIQEVSNGFDEWKIISSPFQTMPMIFKNIRLDGRIWVSEKTEKFSKISVKLDYYYSHFGGGRNGCDLGTIEFILKGDLNDIEDIEDRLHITGTNIFNYE